MLLEFRLSLYDMKHLLIIIILAFFGSTTFAQKDSSENKLIQFSGVIVSGDSLEAVPFCNIIDKTSNRGTVSDYFGYFSFVATKGDTIMFSSVGYKKAHFVIPDTLSTNKYSLIQVMYKDTILLQTAVIYPWPSKEEFAKVFVNADIPNDDYKRAQDNLARADIKERMDAMPMDGAMNFNWAMQQKQSKLYYAGQAPPINLLNPIAWSKFIKAWKNGDFKRKD